MTQIEPRGMTAPSFPAAGWPAIAAKRRPMTLEGWDSSESRLRLQTLTRLRWVAVGGQLATVLAVHFVLGFDLPLLLCLVVIGFSALLNIVMQARFPATKRLQSSHAVLTLAYDLVQLSVLLYLTGGLQNPFSLLMVVPAAISASTQPSRMTVGLCVLSVLCATLLMIFYMPLPWLAGSTLTLAASLYDGGLDVAGVLHHLHGRLRLAHDPGKPADARRARRHRAAARPRAEAVGAGWPCGRGGSRAGHAAFHHLAGRQGAGARNPRGQPFTRRHRAAAQPGDALPGHSADAHARIPANPMRCSPRCRSGI